jgi:3-phenylpropionate/trans-cinnamate dioxygenase ferredoxin reductase component
VVIVGAGHGGFTVAETLRHLGHPGPICLLDAQPGWPYQRPPLSKDYLHRDRRDVPLEFRAGDFYRSNDIDYRAEDPCVAIDRERAMVVTAGGRRLPYDHLVLATGARPLALPVPGHDLPGVCRLHHRDEADELVAHLAGAERAVIVGGGFIGLEVAAAAQSRGVRVTVVEAGSRLMARSVSPVVSEYILDQHRRAGVEIRLGDAVTALLAGAGGRVRGVALVDGTVLAADVVVLGVGVRPRTELAADAGLVVDDGIVVDEYLHTSDCAISAVGDCAAFPTAGGSRVRLESVQNATDHARCVAARLTGDARPYRDVPWFWSHQGADRVQIAGLLAGAHANRVHGDVPGRAFSVLHFDHEGRLVCGESVNRPGDHVALRTLLAHREEIGSTLRDDPDISLKALAKSLRDTQRRLAS